MYILNLHNFEIRFFVKFIKKMFFKYYLIMEKFFLLYFCKKYITFLKSIKE